MKVFTIRFLLFFLLASVLSFGAKAQVKGIDYKAFFADKNLDFKTLPKSWDEAPYFGNGFIGSMVYRDTTDDHVLKIQLFRTDVCDHRSDSSGWTAYSRPRLLIGFLNIKFKGRILNGSFQQNLYSANLSGEIETTEGEIDLHHFLHAKKDLIITEISCKGNENYALSFEPAEAKTTRNINFPDSEKNIKKYAAAYGDKYLDILKIYEPNPKPVFSKVGKVNLITQRFLAGGEFTVAWKQDFRSKSKSIISATIQHTFPSTISNQKALEVLNAFDKKDLKTDFKNHQSWWASFYQRSFMSIPDKALEKMYYLQLYKVGSASRADGPIMDTSGPWFQATPWPYITWDLNVQLCYWLLNTSNHLDIAQSLPNSLMKNEAQLIKNVKPRAWQNDAAYLALATSQDLKGAIDDDQRYKNLHGNLTWTMHNVWLMYRYSMDPLFLKEKCYPLLKRSINYYLHFVKKESDGKYHVPMGYSPEYPVANKGQKGETKDANFDLALISWGLQTLLQASEILNTDADMRSQWKEVLNNLVSYPTDKNGLMIGADLPFTESHRHYSHLLMVYPFYGLNIDEPKNKPLIEQSLNHWIGDPNALQGYSYTGASSISAAIGNGDDALTYLKGLNRFILPNGLYKEKGPVFETPLSAAQNIQDMLLQSWGGKVRIFPAVPSAWKNLEFKNWLAEGAFEISAKMVDGKLTYLEIKSLAGAELIVKAKLNGLKACIDKKTVQLIAANEEFKIDLPKGKTILFTR